MSKFKKSLKRTGNNLKSSGFIAVLPIIEVSEIISEDVSYKFGNKHLGHTVKVVSFGLFVYFPLTVLAMGLFLPAGAVCGILSTLAGAVDIGYGGCCDVIHYLADHDETINPEEPAAEVDSSHATIIKNLSVDDRRHEHAFSQYMQSYLDNFQNKTLFSTRLNELKLSQDEWALFDNYLDPITQELIEIPVILNEQAYDYATILIMLNAHPVEPIKNIPFVARDISPNRHMLHEIEKIVETLIANRQKSEQQIVQQHASFLEESPTQTLRLNK